MHFRISFLHNGIGRLQSIIFYLCVHNYWSVLILFSDKDFLWITVFIILTAKSVNQLPTWISWVFTYYLIGVYKTYSNV